MSEYAQLIAVEDQIRQLENRAQNLRNSIMHGMLNDGVDQAREGGFLFSLRKLPPKLDIDKDLVSPEYMINKPVIDEKRIRRELEEGKILLWAALDDSKTVTLAVKRDVKV